MYKHAPIQCVTHSSAVMPSSLRIEDDDDDNDASGLPTLPPTPQGPSQRNSGADMMTEPTNDDEAEQRRKKRWSRSVFSRTLSDISVVFTEPPLLASQSTSTGTTTESGDGCHNTRRESGTWSSSSVASSSRSSEYFGGGPLQSAVHQPQQQSPPKRQSRRIQFPSYTPNYGVMPTGAFLADDDSDAYSIAIPTAEYGALPAQDPHWEEDGGYFPPGHPRRRCDSEPTQLIETAKPLPQPPTCVRCKVLQAYALVTVNGQNIRVCHVCAAAIINEVEHSAAAAEEASKHSPSSSSSSSSLTQYGFVIEPLYTMPHKKHSPKRIELLCSTAEAADAWIRDLTSVTERDEMPTIEEYRGGWLEYKDANCWFLLDKRSGVLSWTRTRIDSVRKNPTNGRIKGYSNSMSILNCRVVCRVETILSVEDAPPATAKQRRASLVRIPSSNASLPRYSGGSVTTLRSVSEDGGTPQSSPRREVAASIRSPPSPLPRAQSSGSLLDRFRRRRADSMSTLGLGASPPEPRSPRLYELP